MTKELPLLQKKLFLAVIKHQAGEFRQWAREMSEYARQIQRDIKKSMEKNTKTNSPVKTRLSR